MVELEYSLLEEVNCLKLHLLSKIQTYCELKGVYKL